MYCRIIHVYTGVHRCALYCRIIHVYTGVHRCALYWGNLTAERYKFIHYICKLLTH